MRDIIGIIWNKEKGTREYQERLVRVNGECAAESSIFLPGKKRRIMAYETFGRDSLGNPSWRCSATTQVSKSLVRSLIDGDWGYIVESESGGVKLAYADLLNFVDGPEDIELDALSNRIVELTNELEEVRKRRLEALELCQKYKDKLDEKSFKREKG